MRRWTIVVGATAALLASAGSGLAQSQMLIVSGLGGEKEYVDAFYEWGAGMYDAALKLGIPKTHLVFLAEDSTRDRERISGRSTKDNIDKTVRQFAARGDSGDVVMIVLIGHGSLQGNVSLFSMPGPDMSAGAFDTLLTVLSRKKVAFVNTSSGSGDFITDLSGPNRVVVTATRTGFERNHAVFGRYFVRAYAAEGADQDKDSRVSLLEAYEYARLEVKRMYEDEGRILTEHAQLDDNADKKGSLIPDPRTADGGIARGLFISQRLTTGATMDPKLVALYKEKQTLEDKIDALRRGKATMPPAQYEKQLEDLLVSLAEKTAEIRKAEGGGGE